MWTCEFVLGLGAMLVCRCGRVRGSEMETRLEMVFRHHVCW